MNKKFYSLLIIGFILFSLVQIISAEQLYENYNSGADDFIGLNTNNTAGGQGFTIGIDGVNQSFNLTTLSFQLNVSGDIGGTITASLVQGDGSSNLAGPVLSTGTVNTATINNEDWVNFSMSPVTLNPGQQYVAYINGTGTGIVYLLVNMSAGYDGTANALYKNYGIGVDTSRDAMFEVWGVVPNISQFENINVTNNVYVGQNVSAFTGLFSYLGSVISPVIEGWFNSLIVTSTLNAGNVFTQGKNLSLGYDYATNGTYALNSSLNNYLLKSNWNATNTSYYLNSNPLGFYNSTTLPAPTEPNWNGNASSVAYLNKTDVFTKNVNLSNSNLTLTGTLGGLVILPAINLPTCGNGTIGGIGRNSTGLYYCNSTSKWIRLAAG